MARPVHPYVSRGGLKLVAALDAFELEVAGFICADLGCHVGGFTDGLLQRGAAHVFAIDTAYGTLAWKLRQDDRVTVLERTNALHFDPNAREDFLGCDLVCIDLGWTRQRHAIPAALRWLKLVEHARIIALIKPQYETDTALLCGDRRGVLSSEEAGRVLDDVLGSLPGLGVDVLGCVASPVLGGITRGRTGNVEFLALIARQGESFPP